MTPLLEKKAAISGIGRSAIGRRLGRQPMALCVDAVLAAIADAGLTRDDIDGATAYPGSSTLGPPGIIQSPRQSMPANQLASRLLPMK